MRTQPFHLGAGCLSLALAIGWTLAEAPLGAAQGDSGSTFRTLLPAPQEVEIRDGHLNLGASIRLAGPEEWAGILGRFVWLVDDVLVMHNAARVSFVGDSSLAVIRVIRKAQGNRPKGAYELEIGSGGIDLSSADADGVFNGLATLAQLIELCPGEKLELPLGRIRDWPQLATRMVHLDMTCQQFSANYIQRLMRTLARYKINALLMEYSGMFPFRQHKAIARTDAFTDNELDSIRRTAAECNQEIIPLIQFAGHLEYVLTADPAGAKLSENHGGYSMPLEAGGYGYCLTNPDTVPFAKSLIDEIVARHPGIRRLHIGGDEVTAAACKRCASVGDFRALYLDFYRHLADYCLTKGVAPMMWTDVLAPFELRSEPGGIERTVAEAAAVLPHELVGVDWWYRDDEFRVAPKMREAGFQAFTASAARSGTLENFDLSHLRLHLMNIRAGALQAAKSHLLGTLITSWSYRAMPHEVCLPAYALGAAYSWNQSEAAPPALLQRFWMQRYGVPQKESAALAEAALCETDVSLRNPTVETERPHWDRVERSWTFTADAQARQLSRLIEGEGAAKIQASFEAQLQMFAANDRVWSAASGAARQHGAELNCWNFGREHLRHRINLSLALIRMKSGADATAELRRLDEEKDQARSGWETCFEGIFTPSYMKVDVASRFDSERGIVAAFQRSVRPPAASPRDPKLIRKEEGPPAASCWRRTSFDGFVANEIYPVDLDGDGRLELLCLQSPGIYQSKVFDGSKYAVPADMQEVFCLTAITQEGRVLWQVGRPYLKAKAPASHVADQMLWPLAKGATRELAVIMRDKLVILDGASGAVRRSTDLGADNFGIVREFRAEAGSRLLIYNTETAYPPYEYSSPGFIYDPIDLRRIATIPSAVASGHSPRTLDIDGDGNEELLIGLDVYDGNGKRLWTLDGKRRLPTTRYHVDQMQVGTFKDLASARVIYAESGDVEIGTLDGRSLMKKDFGHAQHVVLGNFRAGGKSACIAIFCCRSMLGLAQLEYLEKSGLNAPVGYKTLDNIAFLDSSGAIVSLVFPGVIKVHSGEGILAYPQGCPDGSDAIITRDWGWPQALDLAGKKVFEIPAEKIELPEGKNGPPVGPGPDGYGVRIADFDGDGRADILIHDQTTAWIYQPPYPLKGSPNTHNRLSPITGQGWYGYDPAKPEFPSPARRASILATKP